MDWTSHFECPRELLWKGPCAFPCHVCFWVAELFWLLSSMLLILVLYCFLSLPTWITKAISPTVCSFFCICFFEELLSCSLSHSHLTLQVPATNMRIFLLQSLMINVSLSHEGRDHVCPSQAPIVSLLERMNELPSQHKDFQNPPPTPHFCSWVPVGPSSPPRLPPLPFNYLLQLHMPKVEYISFPSYIIYCHITNYPQI